MELQNFIDRNHIWVAFEATDEAYGDFMMVGFFYGDKEQEALAWTKKGGIVEKFGGSYPRRKVEYLSVIQETDPQVLQDFVSGKD